MKFRRKVVEVEAIQLKQSIGGVEAGNWLVTSGDSQFVLSDEDFRDQYEEVQAQKVEWPQVHGNGNYRHPTQAYNGLDDTSTPEAPKNDIAMLALMQGNS